MRFVCDAVKVLMTKKKWNVSKFLVVFGVLIPVVLHDFCTAMLKKIPNVIRMKQKMSFERF